MGALGDGARGQLDGERLGVYECEIDKERGERTFLGARVSER